MSGRPGWTGASSWRCRDLRDVTLSGGAGRVHRQSALRRAPGQRARGPRRGPAAGALLQARNPGWTLCAFSADMGFEREYGRRATPPQDAITTDASNANITFLSGSLNEVHKAMKPIFNRAPLTPNTLAPLPLGAIKPGGLAEGSAAHPGGQACPDTLFEMWDDVGENCGMAGRRRRRLGARALLSGRTDSAGMGAGRRKPEGTAACAISNGSSPASARTAGSARKRTTTTGR